MYIDLISKQFNYSENFQSILHVKNRLSFFHSICIFQCLTNRIIIEDIYFIQAKTFYTFSFDNVHNNINCFSNVINNDEKYK